jgi:peptide/nickel transport system substrate-binding protein
MLGHTDTISRPAVPSGPAVSVALPTLPTTDDVNSYQSPGLITEVAALTLPSVYLVDPYGKLALDTDLMHGVAFYSDPQQIVYQINPDATWSDGVPVSCDDFYLAWLANVYTGTDPKEHTPLFGAYQTTRYGQANAPQCSDGGRRVTVTFHTPTAAWQTLFAGMLPAHIVTALAGVDDVTSIGKDDTSTAARKLAIRYAQTFATLAPDTSVSAGPYVVTSAGKSEIRLDRNPRWWGNPAGPQAIRLVQAPDDTVAVQQVRNGEVDATSLTDQDSTIAGRLDPMPGYTRTNQAWPVAEHLEFNLRGKRFTSKAGKALRQAVFDCVDRAEIVRVASRPLDPDALALGNMLLPSWNSDYTDHYSDYRSAHPARARQIMQQAGWQLGEDGIFTRGTTRARFTLGALPRASRTVVSTMIQQQCKQAGIDIEVGDLTAVDLYEGKFQAALFAWSAPLDPAEDAYTYTSGSSGNTSGYSNKKVDALFADIESDVKPGDEFGRLDRIDKLMAASQAFLPLFEWTAVNLQSDQIHTTVTNNYYWGGPVWDAYAWTVGG